jgi:hypothetical protein
LQAIPESRIPEYQPVKIVRRGQRLLQGHAIKT